MEQVTELAIRQFEIALKASAEAQQQRERLERLLLTIPPRDYDAYVRATHGLTMESVGLPHPRVMVG